MRKKYVYSPAICTISCHHLRPRVFDGPDVIQSTTNRHCGINSEEPYGCSAKLFTSFHFQKSNICYNYSYYAIQEIAESPVSFYCWANLPLNCISNLLHDCFQTLSGWFHHVFLFFFALGHIYILVSFLFNIFHPWPHMSLCIFYPIILDQLLLIIRALQLHSSTMPLWMVILAH